MNPGSDIGNGRESSVTGRPPLASALTTCLRVGSANAAKTASSAFSEYLTIWFSINPEHRLVKFPSLKLVDAVDAVCGQMRDVAPDLE